MSASTVAPVPNNRPESDAAEVYRTDQMPPISGITSPGVPKIRNPNADRMPIKNPSAKACLICLSLRSRAPSVEKGEQGGAGEDSPAQGGHSEDDERKRSQREDRWRAALR